MANYQDNRQFDEQIYFISARIFPKPLHAICLGRTQTAFHGLQRNSNQECDNPDMENRGLSLIKSLSRFLNTFITMRN